MTKKIVFSVFVVACIIGLAYWFNYLRQVKTPIQDALKAIPNNAAIVVECRETSQSWEKIAETNLIWDELRSIPLLSAIHLKATAADSLLLLNPNIAQFLQDNPFYISFHPGSNGTTTEVLFSFDLPNITYENALKEFIKPFSNGNPSLVSGSDNVMLYSLPDHNKQLLYFTVFDGTVCMSYSKKLVKAAVAQSSTNKSLLNDPNFKKLTEEAGKKVEATVYVNYKKCDFLFKSLFNSTTAAELSQLNSFADCSGWDLTLKPNAIMLSGFTKTTDSTNHFLNLFRNQKPQLIEITDVLPEKTAAFTFFGFSNYSDFHQAQLAKRELSDRVFTDTWKKKLGMDADSLISTLVSNEIATVSLDDNGPLFYFRCNNQDAALETLDNLKLKTDQFFEHVFDSLQYKGHVISLIAIPDLFQHVFGKKCCAIHTNYYTAVDDYIVVANDPGTLKLAIDAKENGKTLHKTKAFQSFSENSSTEANIFSYIAFPKSDKLLEMKGNKDMRQFLQKQPDFLEKFEAAGIQFSNTGNNFFSNAYLSYNPSTKKESSTLWECPLDTSISSSPFLLINHNTKAKELLVQDDANKIYLISNTGKIIWTKQLHEKIMSDVVQVDVLKNNKLQMVFNTRSFIYMFDRNGNDMKGFPIKLRSPATNAIAVIDYENNRDYRLFIATENKRIVCYKATGEQLTAFKFDKTNNPVYLPLQFFRTASKDHLCAVDSKGKIYLLNRQGEIRVPLKVQFPQGLRNYFVDAGKDYSRSFLVSADTFGNVIRISLSGTIEKMKFQDFESSPYFEYRDINNDKTKEYIFLDRNELKVFNSDKSLLFHQTFDNKIDSYPMLFQFPDGKCKIGVVSGANSELFLYNDTGTLESDFPLKGKTAFVISDMNNQGTFNLAVGSEEKSIFVYSLH